MLIVLPKLVRMLILKAKTEYKCIHLHALSTSTWMKSCLFPKAQLCLKRSSVHYASSVRQTFTEPLNKSKLLNGLLLTLPSPLTRRTFHILTASSATSQCGNSFRTNVAVQEGSTSTSTFCKNEMETKSIFNLFLWSFVIISNFKENRYGVLHFMTTDWLNCHDAQGSCQSLQSEGPINRMLYKSDQHSLSKCDRLKG